MDKLNNSISSYGYNIIGFFSSSAAVYHNRTGNILLSINWNEQIIESMDDFIRASIFGIVGFVVPVIGKKILKKIGWSEK